MAMQQQQWQQLPDGRVQNMSTFQIINPKDLTPDQLISFGINNTAPSSPTNYTRSGQVAPTVAQTQAQPQGGQGLNFGASPDQSQQLFSKIFGQGPQDYAGTFQTAYQNLGQPGGKGTEDVISNGTYALADAYIDQILSKTGQLPSEEDVRGFVANNLTPRFADQFIRGMGKDQILANYVEPAMKEQELLQGQKAEQEAIEKGILGLNEQNENLYNAAKTMLPMDVEEAYLPQKQGLVQDLAGQGLLRQRNSRWSLDALDAAKQKSITSGLADINVSKATSGLDIGKTAQNLLAQQRSLAQQGQQFGLDYGLRRRELGNQEYQADFDRGMAQQQLGLAAQLGRQQAEASKPGWMDYLNTGLTGLSSLASAYSGVTKANALSGALKGGASGSKAGASGLLSLLS